MKFAANGTLYRGSKPVMWSVVEKTALAEAEVEYEDYVSDQVWVKFPVAQSSIGKLRRARTSPASPAASVVIWTTTPWTIPGNRAISFSPKIEYGLYQVIDAPADNWAKAGDRFVLADKLALDVLRQARVTAFKKLRRGRRPTICECSCARIRSRLRRRLRIRGPAACRRSCHRRRRHRLRAYRAGHGREDFDVWTANARELAARGINTAIPYTVDADGRFTEQAPGFTGKRVLTDKGEKGDANEAVIKALIEAGMLIARGRLKHQYPHSWRSKKPVIFRNTPQWFIAMDKAIATAEQRQAIRCAPARSPRSSRRAGCRRRARTASPAWSRAARLGDLAPARLGRADHRLHQGEARRLGRDPQRSRK